MMKSCMRTLLALLLALSLLATGLALAEAELEIGEIAQDAAIEAVEAPDALPELALDDGALAIEDVEPDAVEAEANASGEVKINKANFPAEDFRKYVKAHFDTETVRCPRQRSRKRGISSCAATTISWPAWAS